MRTRRAGFTDMGVRETAAACGVSVQAISGWRIAGCPCRRDGKHFRFSLPEVVNWRRKRDEENVIRTAAVNPMEGPASPELERWRKIRADREDIKLSREREQFVSLDELRRQWGAWGARLRTALEAVGMRHGAAVAKDLDEAFAEIAVEMQAKYGSSAKGKEMAGGGKALEREGRAGGAGKPSGKPGRRRAGLRENRGGGKHAGGGA